METKEKKVKMVQIGNVMVKIYDLHNVCCDESYCNKTNAINYHIVLNHLISDTARSRITNMIVYTSQSKDDRDKYYKQIILNLETNYDFIIDNILNINTDE